MCVGERERERERETNECVVVVGTEAGNGRERRTIDGLFEPISYGKVIGTVFTFTGESAVAVVRCVAVGVPCVHTPHPAYGTFYDILSSLFACSADDGGSQHRMVLVQPAHR